jgi:hypothetical protein
MPATLCLTLCLMFIAAAVFNMWVSRNERREQ